MRGSSSEDEDERSVASTEGGSEEQEAEYLPLPPVAVAPPLPPQQQAAVVDLAVSSDEDDDVDEQETQELDSNDDEPLAASVARIVNASAPPGTARARELSALAVVAAGGSSVNAELMAVERPQPTALKKGRKRLRSAVKASPAPMIVTKAQPTECTICYDPCMISGRHRLVALKCGHLFGKKCIERWVLERKSCPNCNVAVKKAEIRPLFSDHVAVVDNSGVEGMKQMYEAEKSKRIQVETELSRAKLQMEILATETQRHKEEALRWRKELTQLQCKVASERFTSTALSQQQLSQPQVSGSGWSYKEVYRYPLQNSRVFDIARSCFMVCVGEELSTTKFGIVKMSAVDPRHCIKIAGHQSPVRDLKISKNEDLVVTVAFDGKLVVSNLNSQSVVLQCPLPPGKRQGWSCTFSDVDPFALYCGFHDGSVAKYDMRKPIAEAVVTTFAVQEKQPVHALRLFKALDGKERLVAATFSSISIWNDCNNSSSSSSSSSSSGFGSQSSSSSEPRVADARAAIPSCCSLGSVQTRPASVLVSSRTLPAAPATHSVFDLTQALGSMPTPQSVVTGHRTPPVLARSAVWEAQDGAIVVASGDDESKQVVLWDAATNRVRHRLRPFPGNQVVIDVQHSVAQGKWSNRKALFGVLSSQQFALYSS
ncbi:hypothetical protein Gpo141_00008111 [Globisporangium polare]